MMRQYLQIKERHRDAILFFRLGDFYEMFFEDAHTASKILDIALTSRNKTEDGVGSPVRRAVPCPPIRIFKSSSIKATKSPFASRSKTRRRSRRGQTRSRAGNHPGTVVLLQRRSMRRGNNFWRRSRIERPRAWL